MIAEALEAAWLVASALAAWIVVGVVAVTVGLYAVVVAVTVPVHAACTALGAALAAAGALRALGEQSDRYRPSQRPAWATEAPRTSQAPAWRPETPSRVSRDAGTSPRASWAPHSVSPLQTRPKWSKS